MIYLFSNYLIMSNLLNILFTKTDVLDKETWVILGYILLLFIAIILLGVLFFYSLKKHDFKDYNQDETYHDRHHSED